jgi:hypothetical protein
VITPARFLRNWRERRLCPWREGRLGRAAMRESAGREAPLPREFVLEKKIVARDVGADEPEPVVDNYTRQVLGVRASNRPVSTAGGIAARSNFVMRCPRFMQTAR